jgi:phospholipase/carboxylesterase
MGTVMSYALALSGDRPAPAGILALSGFVPTVEGWQPALEDRQSLRAFIAHGRRDQLISVQFARQARELLESGGFDVEYHETDGGHYVDPSYMPAATRWLGTTPPAVAAD